MPPINFADTNKEFAEFRRAFEYILKDAPTEPVDAVFLHPLSHGDDTELFPVAAKLISEGKATYVIVNGSDGQALNDPTPGKAWAGKDEYIRQLQECGVDKSKIILSKPAFHTRENNDVFLEIAQKHGWKTAVTLNQPQQLLRATLGQIQVMKDANYWMRIYAIYPEPWDASKHVHGSQGAIQTRRFNLLPADVERILTYQQKGDIATFDEFFNYMAKRSQIR